MRERRQRVSELGRQKHRRLDRHMEPVPLQPKANAPSVPDLILLILLSCPFYGVIPNWRADRPTGDRIDRVSLWRQPTVVPVLPPRQRWVPFEYDFLECHAARETLENRADGPDDRFGTTADARPKAGHDNEGQILADVRRHSKLALMGLGHDAEEAAIIADHAIDAALCGYEYSGLAELLNIPEHRRFKLPRRKMSILRETPVLTQFDSGNNVGMLAIFHAARHATRRSDPESSRSGKSAPMK
jgi:hypothetical protein